MRLCCSTFGYRQCTNVSKHSLVLNIALNLCQLASVQALNSLTRAVTSISRGSEEQHTDTDSKATVYLSEVQIYFFVDFIYGREIPGRADETKIAFDIFR